MAQIEICFDGNGSFTTVDFDELPHVLARDHAFAWIDVDAGKPDELTGLQQQFGLHRIAVESALTHGERPKVTAFDDMLYLEFHGLRLEGEEVRADDIGVFVGNKFIITVRRNDLPSLKPIQDRWRQEQRPNSNGHGQQMRKQPTSAMMLYTILDELVDGYFPVVERIGDEIEALESEVMESKASRPNLAIQHQRTRLMRLRRALSPEQEVLNTLLRRDIPVIEEATSPYFADVHDHVLRIHDWLESYRDQLSTITDLQMSIQSHRLDQTTRTLTNWSIILMSSSLVAGIYGMNFKHMPELSWQYGYAWALGLMVAVGATIYLLFRRAHWW